MPTAIILRPVASPIVHRRATGAVLLLSACLAASGESAQEPPAAAAGLQEQLQTVPLAQLAQEVRARGDAARGALLFYQPQLACTKCHATGDGQNSLGPDLAKAGPEATAEYLVESVLLPAKVVKKGYETVTVVTDDGNVISGLLAEDLADAVVLRDPSATGKLLTIPKTQIDQRRDGGPSIMPAGLASQLGSREDFLDLAKYLIEIAAHGPARGQALRPAEALLRPPPLPDYEEHVDHAGLLARLDRGSFQRGEAIYLRLCVNCHGTREQPGSLPTSLRFADGKFKNGSDPFSMYRTLTHGFGLMTPQTWMVPKQKYDVIHYIRETYLKPWNLWQYVPVDAGYLSRLPRGNTFGPEPVNQEPWLLMDYGPSFCATVEAGQGGANIAYKGIAVRLDGGPGGVARGRRWMLYEHDTLRVSAAWSGAGFIDWNGINFNGRHGVHPRLVGEVAVENPNLPGWANPADGSFADPRLRGRDGRAYGPLPRSWAHFRGWYQFGQQTVLAYTVGETPVLELPGLAASEPAPAFTRTLQLGPRPRPLVMQVACVGESGRSPASESQATGAGSGPASESQATGAGNGPASESQATALKLEPLPAPQGSPDDAVVMFGIPGPPDSARASDR